MNKEDNLEELTKVIDNLNPSNLTPSEIADIKSWGADKVGFIVVNMETQVILFATPGAEEVFGYMKDEMINLELIELIPNEFKGIHPSHVEGFNSNPIDKSMGKRDRPITGRRRDGSTFPLEIGLYPRKFKALRLCLANVIRLAKEL